MSDARPDSDSLADYTESESESASGAEGAPKRPVSTSNSPSKVRTRGSPGRMHYGGLTSTMVFPTFATRTASEPTSAVAATVPSPPRLHV